MNLGGAVLARQVVGRFDVVPQEENLHHTSVVSSVEVLDHVPLEGLKDCKELAMELRIGFGQRVLFDALEGRLHLDMLLAHKELAVRMEADWDKLLPAVAGFAEPGVAGKATCRVGKKVVVRSEEGWDRLQFVVVEFVVLGLVEKQSYKGVVGKKQKEEVLDCRDSEVLAVQWFDHTQVAAEVGNIDSGWKWRRMPLCLPTTLPDRFGEEDQLEGLDQEDTQVQLASPLNFRSHGQYITQKRPDGIDSISVSGSHYAKYLKQVKTRLLSVKLKLTDRSQRINIFVEKCLVLGVPMRLPSLRKVVHCRRRS